MADFPLPVLAGKGFILVIDGLAAFIAPKDGGLRKGVLDVLLPHGHAAHPHVPAFFVAREALAFPVLNPKLNFAQPSAIDPVHAIFSLAGMKVRIAGQDAPAAFPDQSALTELEVNDRDADPCPGIHGYGNFRNVLKLYPEFATSTVTVAPWRNDDTLYNTHIELRRGRVEHEDDVDKSGFKPASNKWKLANDTERYLSHLVHYGLRGSTLANYVHIQLTDRKGNSTSIVLSTKERLVRAAVVNAPIAFTDPESMVAGTFKADDTLGYLPLLANATAHKPPLLAQKGGCTGGTTPECACCPPAWIQDTN